MALLSLSGLDVRYGAIQAVRNLDLEVNEGEIVALLGANGAGKSTTLKAIVGLAPGKGEDPSLPANRSSAATPRRSCAAASPWCPRAGGFSRL
jgi:branched-chain amino acid transport system ATP-binding protein